MTDKLVDRQGRCVGACQEYFLVALSRPREHPSDLEPEEAGPSMFSPKVVGNKVLLMRSLNPSHSP